MKALRLAFALIAMVVLMVALALIVAPASLLRPAANYLLIDYGVEVIAIDGLRLGWQHSSAQRVRVRFPEMSLELRDTAARYRLAEVVGSGRIQSLAVQQAELGVTAGTRGTADPSAPLTLPPFSALLERVETLPFDQLSLAALEIKGDFATRAALTLRARPLQLDATLSPVVWPQWQSELQIRQRDPDQFNATVTLQEQTRPVANAELVLRRRDDRYSLLIDSDIELPAVQRLPPLSALTGDIRVLDPVLQVTAELEAAAGSTAQAITLSSLEVVTGEDALNLEASLDTAAIEARIPMPLSMQGELNVASGRASVSLAALQAEMTIAAELANLAAEFSTTGGQLDCSFSGQCRVSLPAVLTVPNWEAAGVRGENATLTGELQIVVEEEAQRLTAAQLELQLPRLDHELVSGQLTLALEDVSIIAAEDLNASLRLNSRQLDVTLPGVEVIGPAVTSTWNLDGDRLSGSGTVSANRELSMEFAVSHELVTQAGEVSLNLPPLQFSDGRPLSHYVALSELEADIVAGSVAGSGRLSWQSGASGWQLSGPFSLDLDGLSGFAADLLFVDFTTRLEARYQGGRLQSPGFLSATVATVDVGLPMNRIDWEYGFDLGLSDRDANAPPGTVTIRGLRTAMLGGTVEIPEFVYDLAVQTNRLRVVLSRLELAEIVALANYPELQVQGTVSGYLPLLIGPDGVALEEGLVSALQPGGSIRYTPTTAAAGNASVELLNEALSNYLFQTLNAELEYGENGDLEMAVQLRGSNPDMRGGQPINLNVNIANNIPEMLRSLQASRVITERLEQRLNSQ